MQVITDWKKPTGRTCPNGHPVWLVRERLSADQSTLEREGRSCRTCDWNDLPEFHER